MGGGEGECVIEDAATRLSFCKVVDFFSKSLSGGFKQTCFTDWLLSQVPKISYCLKFYKNGGATFC